MTEVVAGKIEALALALHALGIEDPLARLVIRDYVKHPTGLQLRGASAILGALPEGWELIPHEHNWALPSGLTEEFTKIRTCRCGKMQRWHPAEWITL